MIFWDALNFHVFFTKGDIFGLKRIFSPNRKLRVTEIRLKIALKLISSGLGLFWAVSGLIVSRYNRVFHEVSGEFSHILAGGSHQPLACFGFCQALLTYLFKQQK